MLPFRNETEKSLAELKGSETLALPGSHVFHPQNYVINQVLSSALAIQGTQIQMCGPTLGTVSFTAGCIFTL